MKLAEKYTITFLKGRTDIEVSHKKMQLLRAGHSSILTPNPKFLRAGRLVPVACRRTKVPHAKILGNAIFTGH